MWDDEDGVGPFGPDAEPQPAPSAGVDPEDVIGPPVPVIDAEFAEADPAPVGPSPGTLSLVAPPAVAPTAPTPATNVHHLVRFHVTVKDIEPLREKYSGLTFDTPANYEEGRKAIQHCRVTRTRIDKRRKELIADALAYHRNVNSVARELTELIEGIESPLQAKKDAADAEKLRIKREAEEAKKRELEEKVRAEQEAAEAQRKAEREAEEARLRAEREAEEKRLADERAALEAEKARLTEQQRQADERARLERERIEAEQAARRAELDAEAERLKAEREALNEKARIEREQLEAERRAIEDAKRRAEREEAERQAKIRAEKEAAERAERERVEAEERRVAELERQAELARRLEAMKPDIEKVHGFAAEIRKLRAPECASDEAKGALEVALATLGEIAVDLESFGKHESAAAE